MDPGHNVLSKTDGEIVQHVSLWIRKILQTLSLQNIWNELSQQLIFVTVRGFPETILQCVQRFSQQLSHEDFSWRNDANSLLCCFHMQPPGSSHLRADVEVAIDGQNWVFSVLNSQREQSVAAALQELFKQELGRGVQEGLLAVWGADILWRADWGGVFYFLGREEGSLVLDGVSNEFTRNPLTGVHSSC